MCASIIYPDYWEESKSYLSSRDAVMRSIVSQYQGESLSSSGQPFISLCRSIVGQQISVKAADSIWIRLESSFRKFTPENLHSGDEDKMRALGLSRQKIAYLKNIASGFIEGSLKPHLWQDYDDELIIKELTAIKGIGRWTAEMFLIFNLLRPNVFPIRDLGLIKAVNKHYGKPGRPLPEDKILKLTKKWEPYRTVATWYLWRSLDPLPVKY